MATNVTDNDTLTPEQELGLKSVGRQLAADTENSGAVQRTAVTQICIAAPLGSKVTAVKRERIAELTGLPVQKAAQLWRYSVLGAVLAVTLKPTDADVASGQVGGLTPDKARKVAYEWFSYSKAAKPSVSEVAGKTEQEAIDYVQSELAARKKEYEESEAGQEKAEKSAESKVRTRVRNALQLMEEAANNPGSLIPGEADALKEAAAKL